MIEITPDLRLNEDEVQFDFIRSSGPGGQNVNKVSTAVELRFDAVHSPSLPEDTRQRLISLAKSRINKEGLLIIDAQRFRTQAANRQDALDRLIELICKAAYRPPVRRKTRPTKASKERRLEIKRRRSATKQLRSQKFPEE